MYKHILVSTDGSKLSNTAIETAVNLARDTGAKLTGVYVIPTYVAPAYGEGVMYAPALSPKGSVQINDVYVDENRLVYTVDRFTGGMYILEMNV